MARRYGFYLGVDDESNILRMSVENEENYISFIEKIKFISSSHRVIFFLLYRFNAKSGK